MSPQFTREEFQSIQDDFLNTWPIERLEAMTLEEYSNREKTSFTYWLEFKTRWLGSIKGGSSLKFLVYNRNQRSDAPPKKSWSTDGVYAWQTSLGSSAQEVFEVVHAEVLKLVEAGQAMDFEAIEKSKMFGPAVKWKIAAMYNSDHIFQVFNLRVANDMLSVLDATADVFQRALSLTEAQRLLVTHKPADSSALQFVHDVYQMLEAQQNARFEGAHLDLIDVHPELDLLDPRLGSPWLAQCSEPEWTRALDAMSALLAAWGLEGDDARCVISLRNDTSRQRLAIMVGGQLLFSFGQVNDATRVRYQVPKTGERLPSESLDSFQPSLGNGSMVYQSMETWNPDRAWMNRVSEVARQELDRTKSSPYQSSHRPYLLDVLTDEEARASFIRFVCAEPEHKLIEVYKRILVVRGIANERYKWNWFASFKANWDLNAPDFNAMAQWMKFDNLMDSRAHSFWRVLWEDAEEARAYFTGILNPERSIAERLQLAKEESKRILAKHRPDWNSSGQDERTMSMIWAALDLENHAPYKYSFYQHYCELTGIAKAGNNERYAHYLQLIEAFQSEWVAGDEALIEAHQAALGPDVTLADPNHHLLAQNIWFMVLDQLWTEAAAADSISAEESNAAASSDAGGSPFFADSFIESEAIKQILTALRVKKNVILQGPPGTGKTFIARRLAYALMGGKHDDRITTVQFHQSYSYEDFIQGFRPSEDKGFERRDGVFFRFCERARNRPELDHFFIVDEINRGNLSKIFGELMMLIEADKRGPDHQVELTYSGEGETFSIPENVHMIGTMNTADRSLAMVDYALRRRFAFFDIQPAFNDRLRDHLLKNVSAGMADRIIGRLSALNAEIRADGNLGEGFEVGHSYFCHAPAGDEEAWYRHIIEHEVGPQLREYWFDDRAKAEAEIANLKSHD